MMKILSLEAHNVCRVSDIKFDMEGQHLFIVGGKNGNGKTSALNSLLACICGRSGMDNYPEILLKQGEDEGVIRVKIGGSSVNLHEDVGLTAELKLLRKRGGAVLEEFRVLDSSGEEAPEPRTLLKRMFQLKAFDPLSFVRMKPPEQKQLLEKLLDLDFTEEREQYKKLFAERTDVNRQVKAAKARFDGFTFHADVEERSASDLIAEIDKHSQQNSRNASDRTALSGKQESLNDLVPEIDQLQTEFDALAKKLASKKQLASQLRDEITLIKPVVNALVDFDLTPLRGKLTTIEADNEKARSNKNRKAALDQYNELSNKAEKLSKDLDELVETQKKRIEEAEFPVEGMAIDDEGITLNGLPFEQSSRAQRIMASIDVGIALNPELRLMVCENGNDLDDETIAALDAKLADSDFQMIVEICTRSASDEDMCSVIIKDGKVVKTKATAEKKQGLFAE